MAQWIFDKTPASGMRSGGDVAQYNFKPNLWTFVREVIQNAKDQRLDNSKPVNVCFNIRRLNGQFLSNFLAAIQFDNLRKHIESSAGQPNGGRYDEALKNLDQQKELIILTISDDNTTGLCGPEKGSMKSQSGRKNFSSLIRDRLFSDKPDPSAGGSYGLGKAVLWGFSQLSTVLFYSSLSEVEKDQQRHRLIGRVNMPWHEFSEQESFTGDGWFGEKVTFDHSEYASSVWGSVANSIVAQLNINPRRDDEFGSSIIIVGFFEPAEERQRSTATIASEIEMAAANWFWPSLHESRKSLNVRIEEYENDQEISNKSKIDLSLVNPYIEALKKYENNELVTELKNIGDVAKRIINISVPPGKKDDSPGQDAEAILLVRLSEESTDSTDDMNAVAFFRGPGMVTEYRKLPLISRTQRSFHAMLICGEANIEGEFSENDALERFLRNAEPPEHNTWTTTSRLREIYKPGYKKALDKIEKDIKKELQTLISEQGPAGEEGPRLLMQKFPLGNLGLPPQGEKHFHISSNAILVNGEWQFSGEVQARKKISTNWTIHLDFQFTDEEGGGEGGLIKLLSCDKECEIKITNGKATISLNSSINKINFSGRTDCSKYPINPNRCRIRLKTHITEAEE